MMKKILSVLLALSMCLSILPTGAATADAIDSTGHYQAETEPEEAIVVEEKAELENTISENSEMLKSSLLNRIREGSFDPYSSDMTLEEFYALMELFEEGSLPLKNTTVTSKNVGVMYADGVIGDPGVEEPGIAVQASVEDGVIPPAMFDAFYAVSGESIGGLPNWWTGFRQGNVYSDNNTVKMVNEGDMDVNAGFPYITDTSGATHYVRRVTVSGIEASVIGIIDAGENGVNYYYLSQTDQNTQVSTTALAEGQKFGLQYSEEEFSVQYELKLYDKDGTDLTGTLTDDGVNWWLDTILGADRPAQTTDRAYILNATAPDYYTVAIYDTDNGDTANVEMMGVPGYTNHPLGDEPIYDTGNNPVTSSDGYNTMVTTGAYSVIAESNRTVVVVVRRKSDPVFSAQRWLASNNARGRGASAKEGYEFINSDGSLNILSGGDINGNETPNWDWGTFASGSKNMWKDSDGTFSYIWTFQTNSGGNACFLDSLSFNSVDVPIPFSPAFSANKDEPEVGMGNPRSCTTTVLSDGAVVTVEYLYRMNKDQRIYRISITGAKSNIIITGGNLMLIGGAEEYIPQTLLGVKGESFEYYDGGWGEKNKSVPVIHKGALGQNFDPDYGANFRFKLEKGYDDPYYIWENRSGKVIQNQTSVTERDADGNATVYNSVQPLPEKGSIIQSGFIYGPDKDGYYYIRINTQGGERLALLSIHASQVKYVVEYQPGSVNAGNMPAFSHSSSHVTLVGKNQIDDNNGVWYDLTTNYDIPISNSAPYDIDANVLLAHEFRGWAVLDRDGNIVYEQAVNESGDLLYNEDGSPIYVQEENKDGEFVDKPLLFNGNTIQSLSDFAQYAVKDNTLGDVDISVSVIRLAAMWKEISDPISYDVVLNWIDASGNWNEETFSNWPTVWTSGDGSNNMITLTVQVNSAAELLHDWLAQHPTYSFWDEMNNAKNNDEIQAAIEDAFEDVDMQPARSVFEPDGFVRYGNYAFGVDIDKETRTGTVVIWMYENKGGLVFHKAVAQEPFSYDDEFYFTVSDILVGEVDHVPLNGVYFAYPESIKTGDSTAQDAYAVTYVDGNIQSIVKGGEELGNYFTLKDDEGIRLYVPTGQYTLTELGSKSGGSYKADVTYDDGNGKTDPGEDVDMPTGVWLKGSEKEEIDQKEWVSKGVQQVAATVTFAAGEDNVVKTLTFTNQTSSLSVRKNILPEGDETLLGTEFEFQVWLDLPDDGSTPLDAGTYYYYNVNYYLNDGTASGGIIELTECTSDLPKDLQGSENVWTGTLKMYGGGRAVIVMQVLDDGLNYYVEEQVDPNATYTQLTDLNTGTGGHIATGKLEEAVIWNTIYKTGLTLSKVLEGPSADADTTAFTFTITLTDRNDKPISGKYSVETNVDGLTEIVFTDGKATVKLQNGQYVTIKDLGIDSSYEITEKATSGYYISSPGNAAGKLTNADESVVVTFGNAQSVPLAVKKIVEEGDKTEPGSDGENEKEKEFTFTVTFTKGTYDLPESVTADKTLTKVEGSENTYTFKLKHNETITFDNLPYGTEYKITESPMSGYRTRLINTKPTGSSENNRNEEGVSSTTGELSLGLDATFYNEPSEDELYTLIISKTVTGNMGSRTADFEFTVTLKDSQGVILAGSYDTIKTGAGITGEERNTITSGGKFTLKHGQSLKIKNLPSDAEYEIVETGADKYATKVNGTESSDKKASGTITEEITVAYTNSQNSGLPTDATSEYFWLIPILLIGGGGVAWLLLRQKKRRKT